ncbi:putative mitochondrial protein, partial [Mucuna pruriens]
MKHITYFWHQELRSSRKKFVNKATLWRTLYYEQAGKKRQFQLQELDELGLEAYENSRIYKQNLIAGKLRSRWDGPFVITNIFPYGAIELKDKYTNNTFQVNGHQIKLYHEGLAPTVGDMETISLMEPTSYKRRGQSKFGIPVTWDIECIYKPKHSRGRENIVLRKNSATLNRPLMSKTEKPKIIRGDRLDYQRTLVDLILNVLANRVLRRLKRRLSYKERLKSDAKYYIWDDSYLWRLCNDQVITKCIPNAKIKSVLQFCHVVSGGDHYGSTRMAQKVLDCGFYWPTIFKDAYQFASTHEKCQKAGMAISRRHKMPHQPILFYEVFDVWGIDFMGPFSNGYSYILLVVDYVS